MRWTEIAYGVRLQQCPATCIEFEHKRKIVFAAEHFPIALEVLFRE